MTDKEDTGYRKRKHKPLGERLDHSQPREPAEPNERLGIPEKVEAVPIERANAVTFRWGDIRDADCLMTNAAFTIIVDGRAVFFANVQTSDADDVWLVKGLAFMDRNGVELWRMPQFNGPNMVIDDYVYIFHNPNLAYPAYLFPYVNYINMYHHC